MSEEWGALPRSRAAWLCALALALALGAVAWLWLGRSARRRRRRLQQVGVVSQLFLYPVKSCRGLILTESECTKRGLSSSGLRDRHWMVIKKDGHMVSARQEPRLVLISVAFEKDHLTLNAAEMKELHLPIRVCKTNSIYNCRVLGHDIQGRDCGDEVADWITTFLKSTEPYRLVHFEDSMQMRTSKEEYPAYDCDDQVAYPDLSPILLFSEASLEDLNGRLEKKVKVQNFRPNIVVTSCGAFEEDTWDEILIGNLEMKRALACPRCILTTVDPDTGIITRKEPLDTLKSYRLCDPSEKHIFKAAPLFGQFFGILKTGSLKVGDPVYKMLY
ncbi:mitochondrial amidoxime reducing component 2 [Rhinatrema bivittatum]|uniref:mitochondrial amidoxime reducing component 2 n=1 Tax=Rhinatrema bivittatum TaxID=194408 RepID=UPI00112C70E5|nr:mitochondrial amidoxime reducing component 2 [Rhinatrema bivittatum]